MIIVAENEVRPRALIIREEDVKIPPGVLYYKTLDDKTVVNRPNSHVSRFALGYLKEMVQRIDTAGRMYITEEIEYPWIIGYSQVVETKPGDLIYWGIRKRRDAYVRVVLGRPVERSRYYTVVLKRMHEDRNAYLVMTAYIGRGAEAELVHTQQDEYGQKMSDVMRQRKRERCEAYWSNHAHVFSLSNVIPGTLQSKRPSRLFLSQAQRRAVDDYLLTGCWTQEQLDAYKLPESAPHANGVTPDSKHATTSVMPG